ncbi:MAG: AAA family ATPase [Pseudomonadota bacterium]
MQSVSSWLKLLSLEQYSRVFADNDVDLDVLRILGDKDLQDLGVSFGHRKKLLKAIAELNGAEANQLAPSPAAVTATGGERRQLTVLFCDMVGFTELASRVDPEVLQRIIRSYEDACAVCVTRYEGYVFQRLGDGIVAFFGYPLAHEGEGERAIRAGLEIIESLTRLNVPDAGHLQVRIGVATGLVVVAAGEKGAVGETMNLAARLQAIAAPGSIVVSERVQRLAGGAFDYKDLGEQTLKGMARPTHAYRILGVSGAASRFDAATGGILTPLVGREQEIGLLLERWQLTQEGEGQVVLLSGEPGIGKSRVLSALRERLEGQGAQALRFQCSPYYVNSAFWPSIDNFERALKFGRDEQPESKLDKLEALIVTHYGRPLSDVRFIASMLSIPCEERYGALPMTPQKHKDETLRTLVDLTEAAVHKQPSVMLYEDLHWADPTTLEVLDLLIDRVRNVPLLIVLTHRPEFQSRWSEHGHVTALNLAKLTRAQSGAMVSKIAGGKALPADLLEQIVAKTDGVPLFVEELTKSILESGNLKDFGDRYDYASAADTIAIPATLRDSLMARLDRFMPVKEIAQIGAAIGREFSYELFSAVASLPRTELDDGLARLTESGLAFRRGAIPEAVYVFKHALVQDAAYDSLLKARRTQIHVQIATVLEKQFPAVAATQPERVAHHYSAAGLADQAIPYWRKAGQLALQRVAVRDAIAHLDRGMSLLQQVPESPGRDAHELELCTTLGMAWLAYKGWAHPNVASNLERAWSLERALNRSDHMLPILYGLSIHRMCIGQIRESMSWAERLLDEGERSDLDDMRLMGHTQVETTSYFLGEFASISRHAEAILTRYDPVRHRHLADMLTVDPKSWALVYHAFAQWALGYPERSAQTLEEGIRHTRARGHLFDLAWTLQFAAKHLDVYRHEPGLCAAKLDEFERLVHEQKIDFFEQIVGPICRAAWLLISDRPQESEALFRESIPRWAEVGLAVDIPYYKTLHAQSAALSGRRDVALTLIEEALEQIERPGWEEKCIYAEALRVKGWILQLGGDEARAEAEFVASLEVSCQQQAKSWELRAATSYARLLKSQNRRKEALELLEPIYLWFTEGFDTKDLKEAKAMLVELR